MKKQDKSLAIKIFLYNSLAAFLLVVSWNFSSYCSYHSFIDINSTGCLASTLFFFSGSVLLIAEIISMFSVRRFP